MQIKRIFLLVMFVVIFPAVCRAYDDGDFQIWNTNTEELKLGKGSKLTIQEEYRYGEGASELFYQHYDWGLAYAFDKRLELDFGYRFILEKNKRKWREKDVYYTHIIPKIEIGKLKIDDRNRIEYQHTRFSPDQAVYRNRLTAKYPFDFKKLVLAPYVNNEIFIASNSRGYNQNRFQSGIEIAINKYAKADIAYMLQSIRGTGNKWSVANVLRLNMKVSF